MSRKSIARSNRRRRSISDRKGATSVEFALVFPIILAFFIGVTAMTQAFLLRDTSQQAAYEAARHATILTATNESAEDAAQDFLNIMRIRGAEIEVSPSLNTATDKVTATVSIPFNENAWVGAGFMPDSWHASASVTLIRFTKDDE